MNGYGDSDPLFLFGLFRGAGPPTNPFVPKDLFPVFDSPSVSELMAQFLRFHHLHLPERNFLRSIIVGSVEATTADNKFFGIRKGRSVTIHLVYISSGLKIGYFTDFRHYDTLVQEITVALLSHSNRAFVSASLLPLFLGRQANVSLDLIV